MASDINELVEIRARQRTFHGAYSRTALGSLGYALTILRLFDPAFHRSAYLFFRLSLKLILNNISFFFFYAVGLLFTILGALLFILAFIRSQHSTHDFADRHKEAHGVENCIKTKGQDGGRIFGRPFVTAGWIVIQVTVIVAAAEIAILVLILRHNISVR